MMQFLLTVWRSPKKKMELARKTRKKSKVLTSRVKKNQSATKLMQKMKVFH